MRQVHEPGFDSPDARGSDLQDHPPDATRARERLVQRALEGPARKRSVGAAQVLGRP
jgi:hypothetical protein